MMNDHNRDMPMETLFYLVVISPHKSRSFFRFDKISCGLMPLGATKENSMSFE